MTLMPSVLLRRWKNSSKIFYSSQFHKVGSISNRFKTCIISKPYGNAGSGDTNYTECNKLTMWLGAGYDGNSCLHPSQQERGRKEIDELGRL